MNGATQIDPATVGPGLYEFGRTLKAAGQKEVADKIMELAGILIAVAKAGPERCNQRLRGAAR